MVSVPLINRLIDLTWFLQLYIVACQPIVSVGRLTDYRLTDWLIVATWMVWLVISSLKRIHWLDKHRYHMMQLIEPYAFRINQFGQLVAYSEIEIWSQKSIQTIDTNEHKLFEDEQSNHQCNWKEIILKSIQSFTINVLKHSFLIPLLIDHFGLNLEIKRQAVRCIRNFVLHRCLYQKFGYRFDQPRSTGVIPFFRHSFIAWLLLQRQYLPAGTIDQRSRKKSCSTSVLLTGGKRAVFC